MTVIKFRFIDEIGEESVKEDIVDCDFSDDDLDNLISYLNGVKWRSDIDFGVLNTKIHTLDKCELLKTKKITRGGYTGGPIGMRKYVFPHISEKTFTEKEDIKTDKTIKCDQEGSRLFCRF